MFSIDRFIFNVGRLKKSFDSNANPIEKAFEKLTASEPVVPEGVPPQIKEDTLLPMPPSNP